MSRRRDTNEILEIGEERIAPGERKTVDIPVARPYTQSEIHLQIHAVNGREAGPHLFVCGAIHGDEINGVEIVRRLLRHKALRRLRGALLAVPVVNVYGFISQSRYLPDRRDLNRSFPGSARGSLASRLAHQFMSEVVANATHGIDLHTGAAHRTNFPQIRACLDQPETEKLARAFGAPVILNSNLRDGSLRAAVLDQGIPMLLYEAGEALRFNEVSIRGGVRGVLAVMRELGMLPPTRGTRRPAEPVVANSSSWVRAPESGILSSEIKLGERVVEGQRLGVIGDPMGQEETPVTAAGAGIVIGATRLPLVNEGDALFHIASFDRPKRVAQQVEAFQAALDPDLPGGALEPPETRSS